jgi:molybdopterin/thiamine biosynthesis adenylyltransferase
MSTAMDLASSRPLGVAKELGAATLDQAVVFARSVILTGERAALETENGRWCLLNSIRLLARVVGPLLVVVPHGMDRIRGEVTQLCESVWTKGHVTVADECCAQDWAGATAILNVGTRVKPHLPWTTINSNGWLARVSSFGDLPGDTFQSNPLGAMLAASLGVTEVFKRVYGIPGEKYSLLHATQFSLFELSSAPTGLGPKLTETSLPDTLLVGAGAIGNAIVLLLSQLRLRGRLHIVDKQVFAVENLGTCVVLDGQDWLDTPKAGRLANWLRERSALVCTGEQALVESARSGEYLKSMAVDLVLAGLDDVAARWDVQLLWPSVLVDGGINAVGAAAVTHRLDRPSGACMRCSFRLPLTDERAVQSQLTGLARASLESDLGRALTEQDVLVAKESMRPWLRDQVAQGKTLCATISDAQTRALGMKLEDGFRPSAPFVATASAALVVAQALKALAYPEAEFTQRFQFENVFLGPDAAVGVLTLADPNCLCVSQRPTIEHVRAQRQRRGRDVPESTSPL